MGAAPDTPEQILAHLQLRLLSLLPGYENIGPTADNTGISHSLLLDMYNLGDEPYERLLAYLHNRIVAVGNGKILRRIHFCFLQLAAGSPSLTYAIMTHPGYRGTEGLPQRLQNCTYGIQQGLKTYGHEALVNDAVYNLSRLCTVLSAQPAYGPWWDMAYLPLTRVDIDTYIMHLRQILKLTHDV